MRRNRRGGFTLLELVVAVAIMLIIGAAATPLLLSHLKDAKAGNLNENLLNVKTAFNSYYTSEEGVLTDSDGDGDYLDEVINAGWLANDPSNARWTFEINEYQDGTNGVAYYVAFNATTAGNTTSQVQSLQTLDEKIDDSDGNTAGTLQWDVSASTAAKAYYKLFAEPGVTTWHP